MAKQNSEKQGPVKTFRAGGVSAKIWKNEISVQGKPQVLYNVAIERTYKDQQSGEFKTTSSFKQNDLPKVALAAQKAFEHLVMRDDASDEDQ